MIYEGFLQYSEENHYSAEADTLTYFVMMVALQVVGQSL